MIKETLKKVIENLNDFLDEELDNQTSEKYAVLSHMLEENQKIHVSLINTEEDSVFKNQVTPPETVLANHAALPAGQAYPNGGIHIMRLNLYVLFAFNPGDSISSYENSLILLSAVLKYFHTNPVQPISLSYRQHPVRLKVTYHNINLEDSNNIWSGLDNKHRPYAMYKFQLLEILPKLPDNSTPAIRNFDQQQVTI